MACYNYTVRNDSSTETQVRYVKCGGGSGFVYVEIGNSTTICADEGSVIPPPNFTVTLGGTCTGGTEPPPPEPTPPPPPEEEPVTVTPAVGVPIVYKEQIVLSRSPFNFKLTSTVLFDNVAIDMYLYTGDRTAKPALPTYNFTKKVIQAGQIDISIEIHQMLNDMVKANLTNVTGVQTTTLNSSVWCYLDATILMGTTELYKINQQLLAVDGFGYHTELFNPVIQTKVLSSVQEHLIYNSLPYNVYFKTDGLTDIIINGTAVVFTFDSTYSNQVIASIDVSDYIGVDEKFTAQFVYETGIETHTFTVKEECKYPVISCIFKNKYGYWQTIFFNKLSKKGLNITNSSYQPIVSSHGEYDLMSHNERTTEIKGSKTITANTDFIPEELNRLFEELYFSEFIYIKEGSQILPVNLNRKTWEEKTKIKDKLIQYAMDFKYSFNLINQVT